MAGPKNRLLDFAVHFKSLRELVSGVCKDLPKDWKVHNVFHVSLLKRYVSDPNHVLPNFPRVVLEGEMLAKPERILQVDLLHLRNRSFRIFPLNWKAYPEDEALWELENEFKKTYPNFVIAHNNFIERKK